MGRSSLLREGLRRVANVSLSAIYRARDAYIYNIHASVNEEFCPHLHVYRQSVRCSCVAAGVVLFAPHVDYV